MKFILAVMVMAVPLFGQSWCTDDKPCKNYLAIGTSIEKDTMLTTGTILYNRTLNKYGTGWATFGDFIPVSSGSGQSQFLLTSGSTGVSQRILSFGNVGIYAVAAAGFSTSTKATGWSLTPGVMFKLPYIDLNTRAFKSSVNNRSGWGWMFGSTFGIKF